MMSVLVFRRFLSKSLVSYVIILVCYYFDFLNQSWWLNTS